MHHQHLLERVVFARLPGRAEHRGRVAPAGRAGDAPDGDWARQRPRRRCREGCALFDGNGAWTGLYLHRGLWRRSLRGGRRLHREALSRAHRPRLRQCGEHPGRRGEAQLSLHLVAAAPGDLERAGSGAGRRAGRPRGLDASGRRRAARGPHRCALLAAAGLPSPGCRPRSSAGSVPALIPPVPPGSASGSSTTSAPFRRAAWKSSCSSQPPSPRSSSSCTSKRRSAEADQVIGLQGCGRVHVPSSGRRDCRGAQSRDQDWHRAGAPRVQGARRD